MWLLPELFNSPHSSTGVCLYKDLELANICINSLKWDPVPKYIQWILTEILLKINLALLRINFSVFFLNPGFQGTFGFKDLDDGEIQSCFYSALGGQCPLQALFANVLFLHSAFSQWLLCNSVIIYLMCVTQAGPQ